MTAPEAAPAPRAGQLAALLGTLLRERRTIHDYASVEPAQSLVLEAIERLHPGNL